MKLYDSGVTICNGRPENSQPSVQGKEKTIAYAILESHTLSKDGNVRHIRFDSLTSHDITYVGIIQTARASGMTEFPMPYVLTNCHNSLCAVGGTINEDDHAFALSAAKKYGGIYVPPCLAVIHSYNREMMSGCGRMILGSDSHTRYGALGTLGVGEGGGELAKQLVGRTYDIAEPRNVLIWLTGAPRPGVGPHDVALALIAAVYANGYVKNSIMEFAGPGIASLSQDFRNGIDVMTTETTCWSSVWETDEVTRQYFVRHGREDAYKELKVQEGAYYDGCIELDLSAVECMIALPMHPSHALPIRELNADPYRYLKEAEDNANRQLKGSVKMDLVSHIGEDGKIHVDQGIIAGCSGGVYENIVSAAKILQGKQTGNDTFRLSVYPDSMPANKALADQGVMSDLLLSGAVWREAFCGPCFGAGETPANNEFSIRHTTRNFPNREGSKPNEGQIAAVALMDARSIAATAANGGVLCAATDVMDAPFDIPEEVFDARIYANRVYNGYGHAQKDLPLRFGPNIKDWPAQIELTKDILVKVVSFIDDPVTTTDELIPSGETSSFRSNPLRLAEFTLSRRDPEYVGCAKDVQKIEKMRQEGTAAEEVQAVAEALAKAGCTVNPVETAIGSAVYANRPGDGSAREQAASCQRVLGGIANFAQGYATKRYRSNCINWGILPFITEDKAALAKGTWVYIPDVAAAIDSGAEVSAYAVCNDTVTKITLSLQELTDTEKQILKDGCLINYYRNH